MYYDNLPRVQGTLAQVPKRFLWTERPFSATSYKIPSSRSGATGTPACRIFQICRIFIFKNSWKCLKISDKFLKIFENFWKIWIWRPPWPRLSDPYLSLYSLADVAWDPAVPAGSPGSGSGRSGKCWFRSHLTNLLEIKAIVQMEERQKECAIDNTWPHFVAEGLGNVTYSHVPYTILNARNSKWLFYVQF